MQKIEFKVNKQQDLIKAVIDQLPFFSRYDVQKILTNKDIKVNGNRCIDNILLNVDDVVTVYYNIKQDKPDWYTLVYQDDNIIIVNKRAGIEVVSVADRDLVNILKQQYNEIFSVHRIDRNTEGLVIFAKNRMAEQELLNAFETRKGIIKKYALMVHGKVEISKIKRTVYLKKVPNLKKVWISEIKTSGYEPVATEFNILEYRDNATLLEANLITGKTHQIRAHIAYYGYPIIGDNKYGKDQDKVLHLTSYFLTFNLNKKCKLSYLNLLNFEIVPTWL